VSTGKRKRKNAKKASENKRYVGRVTVNDLAGVRPKKRPRDSCCSRNKSKNEVELQETVKTGSQLFHGGGGLMSVKRWLSGFKDEKRKGTCKKISKPVRLSKWGTRKIKTARQPDQRRERGSGNLGRLGGTSNRTLKRSKNGGIERGKDGGASRNRLKARGAGYHQRAKKRAQNKISGETKWMVERCEEVHPIVEAGKRKKPKNRTA